MLSLAGDWTGDADLDGRRFFVGDFAAGRVVLRTNAGPSAGTAGWYLGRLFVLGGGEGVGVLNVTRRIGVFGCGARATETGVVGVDGRAGSSAVLVSATGNGGDERVAWTVCSSFEVYCDCANCGACDDASSDAFDVAGCGAGLAGNASLGCVSEKLPNATNYLPICLSLCHQSLLGATRVLCVGALAQALLERVAVFRLLHLHLEDVFGGPRT